MLTTPPALRPGANATTDDPLQLTMLRASLAAEIERHTGHDGGHATAYGRLWLARSSCGHHPVHGVYEPALCVVVQGAKRMLLGHEVYLYDSSHYLLVAQNLPVSGQVVEASPEAPYLGLKLDFDPRDVAAMTLELGLAQQGARSPLQRGLCTGPLSAALLEPLLRLVRLLATPADVQALAPLAVREVLYRLLKAPEGWQLAQMALADSPGHRISQAIHLLQQQFAQPLRVEELAAVVHMSVSSLHHHFKAVTAMSPLQFQKQLRLQEARRLLLAEPLDAATAGRRVGYDSPSQFNREYARFFGAPPARDIKRLRQAAPPSPGTAPALAPGAQALRTG